MNNREVFALMTLFVHFCIYREIGPEKERDKVETGLGGFQPALRQIAWSTSPNELTILATFCPISVFSGSRSENSLRRCMDQSLIERVLR